MQITIQGSIDEVIAFAKLLEKARNEELEQKKAEASEGSRQVRAFIKNERFIDAIKQRRLETGESLAEAKTFCDQLRVNMSAAGLLT